MRIVVRIAIVFTIVCAFINSGYTQVNNNACGLEMFQCGDGECISGELLCDGKANCKDQSDETEAQCTRPEILCPDYAFRCKYGACINRDVVCNGIRDCVDNSDETLPQCTTGIINNNQTDVRVQCRINEVACNNGECISNTDVCDGIAQCKDGSDETREKCGELVHCPLPAFQCDYGACIDGDKACNGVVDCVDRSDETSKACRGGPSWPSPFPTVPSSTPPVTSLPPVTPTIPSTRFCKTPPQPPNGYWKLHRSQCEGDQDCDISEGINLQLGSYLVYFCNPGYKIRGSADVSCSLEGWLNIPVCTEIRCKALSTASTAASCRHNGKWVTCATPVLPRTLATLECRNGYKILEGSRSRNSVTCNENGQWEPEPLRCIPECGTLPSADIRPLAVGGERPNITEFPWHASLYLESASGDKKYFCGATIVQENLLITAAHCVYNDNTNKVIENPRRIHVLTGNIYRDYNFAFHDQEIVRSAQVKNIYVACKYTGFKGNYALDIAILELMKPFELSALLKPACIDTFTFGDRVVLEAGTYGKVAGFGRTATGDSSAILQALRVPYVPYGQCKSATSDTEKQKYITEDKFCAGYTNGSSVCDGDSGGGLVFKTGDLWYLRGIVSVSLGTVKVGGSYHCDPYLYSLYTRISNHISWIQEVIDRIDQNRQYSLCADTSYIP